MRTGQIHEGRAKEDNERRGKDGGPQLSNERVPKVEEVGTHHFGLGVGEGAVMPRVIAG